LGSNQIIFGILRAMETGTALSVILAVYNKQHSIQPVYDALVKAIEGDLKLDNYEILFVDDCSTDQSREMLNVLSRLAHVKVIYNRVNEGQLKCLEKGLALCTGNTIVMTSCDLQNPLEQTAILYRALHKGYDCALAYRTTRKETGINSFLAGLFWRFIALVVPKFPKGGFDFVAFTRNIKEQLLAKDFSAIFLQLELLRLAKSVYQVPVIREADLLDHSAWNFKKRFIYATRVFKYLIHKN
jgi:glycosyltransferase involved in cell wall biosynthesis